MLYIATIAMHAYSNRFLSKGRINIRIERHA